MLRFASVVVPCLLCVACGGSAQLVLKTPIEDRCVDAGLNGCPQIAEGATLFADGKTDDGERQLKAGLLANAEKAKELKKFADALEIVGKLPGAGPYVAPLQPAIQLVQVAANEAQSKESTQKTSKITTTGNSTTPQGATANASPPPNTDGVPSTSPIVSTAILNPPKPEPPRISSFWLPTGNALASECRFAGTPKMTCIHESIESPKVISDVMVSAACPVDVLVVSRQQINLDWLVYVPAGKGIEIHGASLPLNTGHALTIANTPATTKTELNTLDIRCGVTTVWQEQPQAKQLKEKPGV